MHRKHPDPETDRKIRLSLRFSILDGASFAVMLGSAEIYFQAFALFLGASVFQAGIIYTIPIFLAAVIQLYGSGLLGWFKSRKNLAVLSGALRSLLFVPLILVYFLGAPRVWVLLGIISLYFALNFLPLPAWTSWMRDLVDENKRGVFFSRRNRLANLIALLSIVVAGIILEAFQIQVYLGFAIIFSVALMGSIGSTVFLSLKYDAPYSETPAEREGLLRFSAGLFRTNFGRFVLFNIALHFAVFFAAAYFVPYFLNDLGMSYLQFMIANSLVVLVKFLSFPLWGELGDRYGNKKILVMASLMIALLAFFWLFSRAFWWICVTQSLFGLAWAGFDLSAQLFTFDVSPEQKIAHHTSYLIFYRGLAVFVGGLVGGLLFKHLTLFKSSYYGNFFVSGLLRLFIAFPLLLLLKEERSVEHISYRQLMFKLVSIGPKRGLQFLLIGPKKRTNHGDRGHRGDRIA